MSLFHREKVLVMNTSQFMLAVELAAQQAARREYEKQLGDQLPKYASVRIKDCNVDMQLVGEPKISLPGFKVVWQ